MNVEWEMGAHLTDIREWREWSEYFSRCQLRVGWRSYTIWHHSVGYSQDGKDHIEKVNFLRQHE